MKKQAEDWVYVLFMVALGFVGWDQCFVGGLWWHSDQWLLGFVGSCSC